MGSATLTNGLETGVAGSNVSANFDYQTRHGLKAAPGEQLAYLHFTRPFPLKATILSAKLHIFVEPFTQTGTKTITATPLKQAVAFNKVTYTTRPTQFYTGRDVVVSKTGPQAAVTEWIFDVTSVLQSVANGDAWYGWRLSSNFEPSGITMSPTHPTIAYRPYLEVVWSDAPQKPSGLLPAAGRLVGLTKPVVRANYVDVSGSTVLSALQVQTAATESGFGAPAWDSGTVASTVPELNLATTTFPALADLQTIWWRIRLQDAAGLWSEWSDPATFTRDAKGTLAVSSPAAGTVTDVTPPVTWALTGETQAAYQVFVQRTLDPADPTLSRPIWTSGKVTSTATSITLPSGVLLQAGVNYDLTVRVWDAKNRESGPGDPAYVEVTRTFQFTPSSTVAGVATLTATAQDPKPNVVLGFTRAQTPDSFTVIRNGKVVASGLLPADLAGGPQFAWTDHTVSPNRSHSYQVLAVVNGVASATNPSAAVTPRPIGMWLRDPASGLEICLTGREERKFVMAEVSALLEPIADRAPKVLVTQAQSGLEGVVSGSLAGSVPGFARTAEQQRDSYLKLRQAAGRRYFLTVGDYTFQVVCRNWTYAQRPIPEKLFDVSFEFIQVNSLDTLATAS